MLIEDAADNREATRLVLEDLGVQAVRTVPDGLDALAMLETMRPDLILCDLRMPRVDGLEFLRRLRLDRRWQDIPVILVSAVTALRSEASGFDGHLDKPFSLDDLEEALHGVLRGRPGGSPDSTA